MGTRNLIRDAWELIPISLLLVVGGAIAIRSGVRGLATRQDFRQVLGNVSHVMLRVIGYVAALLLVNQFVGMRLALGW
jgi:hypothetical protein